MYENKKFKAQYSIYYPKIIYNNEIYDNLKSWLMYIKKNECKNKMILNFIKQL